MKMTLLGVLLLAVGLSGCMSQNFTREKPKPPPEPVVEKAPAAVTEDQVNEKNAPEQAKALRAELEYKLRHAGEPARD